MLNVALKETKRIARWFRALSEVTRVQIMQVLCYAECSVGELERVIDVTQPRLSYHLKILRKAGLVRVRREGRWRYYSVRRDDLAPESPIVK